MPDMPVLNFEALIQHFGETVAYQCLVEIEKAARIQSWRMAEIDPAERLERALQAQDAAMMAVN